MRTIYALSPNLFDEVGHVYRYQSAFERAVCKNGWKYVNFIPKGCSLKTIPPSWVRALPNDFWNRKKTFFFRLGKLFTGFFSFLSIFRKIGKEENGVIFLENFELQNLVAILFAILLSRPHFSLWLLHRYEYGPHHFKTRIYRFFHWIVEKKIPILYLTDSEPLQMAQQALFLKPIHVLPIPHTASSEGAKTPSLLWWPGGSIRKDKGLLVVQRLVRQIRPPFRLALAESARPFLPSSDQLLFLPPLLAETEYLAWMSKAEFVLLPHDPREYEKRTSGIFVEAVVAGAIPLVSKGTWMAYELEKFGVFASIFDWEEDDLFSRLSSPFPARKELGIMQRKYQEFHTEQGLATSLLQL